MDIEAYLDGCRTEMIEELAALVNIPSISSDPDEVKRSLRCALDLAVRLGLSARAVLDESVGVIEMGSGDETLGILSHVDVVPPGNMSLWKSDPFRMEVRDGRLYGRGTIDDKGAVIACLYAMNAVKSLKKPLKKKVQLILGTQEEVEWRDMREYVKQFPLPDYGFTPDGEFPVCNTEKGFAEILITVPADFGQECGGEKTARIKSIDGGSSPNTIPNLAKAVFVRGNEKTSITAHGISAHSCLPSNGENAILKLCGQIVSMAEDRAQNLLPDIFIRTAKWLLEVFSDTEGRGVGLYREKDTLDGEFIHRNTVAPTMIATKQDRIEITFNARFTRGTTGEEVERAFKQAAEKVGGTAKIVNMEPVVYFNREEPFLKLMAGSYEKVSGLENEFIIAYGGSYAKAMPGIVSWGPLFPGEEDTCHMENEYISIDSLMLNAKIFADLIASAVLTEQSFRFTGSGRAAVKEKTK